MRALLVLVCLCMLLQAQDAKPTQPAPSTEAVVAQRPEAALALEAQVRARLAAPMTVFDLDLVLLGDDFFGTEPQPLRFSADGKTLWFSWKRWDERETGTWACSVADGSVRRLAADEEMEPASVWSADHTARAWVLDGALHVASAGEQRVVARLAQAPHSVQFSADGKALVFRSGDGWFRAALGAGGFEQLLVVGKGHRAALKTAPANIDPAKVRPSLADWHKEQERALFRVHWEEFERSERERVKREAKEARHLGVFTYEAPDDWRCTEVILSPAGTHAVALIEKEGPAARGADIPEQLSADGYAHMRPTRSKVGSPRHERRAELIDIGARRISAIPESGPGMGASAAAFSPDGLALLLCATAYDDTRAHLIAVNLDDAAVELLHEVRDDAWVLTRSLLPEWLGATGHCGVFTSEKDGWMHVWRVDALAREVRQLTRGRFEVSQVEPDPDGRRLWCVATPLSPHVRELVCVDAADGSMTVVSNDGGGRRILLGPDGATLAEVHSKPNRPWELRLRTLRGREGGGEAAGVPRTVTDSPSPAFRGHPWIAPEIVQIPASDGVQVPARIYRPDGEGLRPAVIFVHGAGYLQNVHDWWSRYAREYAFHHLLRAEGFVVLDVDYRGSSGYGRDWRTAIREHMGGRDLDDQVDAVRWLVEHERVDPARVGIYGGSYGGFITLMALFTKPDVFAVGAALRPVTDWAHYNDGYTANILDSPTDKPEAFKRSSPIHFAEGLRGRLLICHGLRDDNVHAQDSVRLQQRLIELRKTDWEVAYYPSEAHAFRDAASWADEYRRIHALMLSLQPAAGR